MQDDRDHWNRKYSERPESWREPDEFLLRAYENFVAPAFPSGGRALDVAGGPGRNALWLAQRGWRVELVDVSDVAVEMARRSAAEQGVLLEAVRTDLDAYRFEAEAFDLVMVFMFLERALFPALSHALRPGGLLLYCTYTLEQPRFGRGPTDPEHLLQPGELRSSFRELEILHYAELVTERAVAELVARKPARAEC